MTWAIVTPRAALGFILLVCSSYGYSHPQKNHWGSYFYNLRCEMSHMFDLSFSTVLNSSRWSPVTNCSSLSSVDYKGYFRHHGWPNGRDHYLLIYECEESRALEFIHVRVHNGPINISYSGLSYHVLGIYSNLENFGVAYNSEPFKLKFSDASYVAEESTKMSLFSNILHNITDPSEKCSFVGCARAEMTPRSRLWYKVENGLSYYKFSIDCKSARSQLLYSADIEVVQGLGFDRGRTYYVGSPYDHEFEKEILNEGEMSFVSMKNSRRPFSQACGDRQRSYDDSSLVSVVQSKVPFDSPRLHKLVEGDDDSCDTELLIKNCTQVNISTTSGTPKTGRSLSDDYENLEMITNRLLSGNECNINLLDFLSGGSGLEQIAKEYDNIDEPDCLFSRNIDDVFVEKIDTNQLTNGNENFYVHEITLNSDTPEKNSNSSKDDNTWSSFNVYREQVDHIEQIEIDDQSKYESSDSEPEEEFYAKLRQNAKKFQNPKNEEDPEKNHPNYMGPRVKDELSVTDMPEIEELRNLNLEDDAVLELVGRVSSIVGLLVVVKSTQSMALDEETILFNEDKTVFGSVFEVFGPVKEPFYSVRFKTMEDIKKAGVKVGTPVFCCLTDFELTKVVFQSDLPVTKGSDASWKDDHEPPDFALQYSDDEEERRAKREIALRRRAKRLEAELVEDEAENDGQPTNPSLDSDERDTLENEDFIAEGQPEKDPDNSNDEMENALAKVRKEAGISKNGDSSGSSRSNSSRNAMFPEIGAQTSNRNKKKARNKPKKGCSSQSKGILNDKTHTPGANESSRAGSLGTSVSSGESNQPLMRFSIAPSRISETPFIPPVTGIIPSPNQHPPLPSPASNSFSGWPRSPVSSFSSPGSSVYQAATQIAFQGPVMGMPSPSRYPPPPNIFNGNRSFFSPREPLVPQYPTSFQPSFQRSYRPRTSPFSTSSRR